MEVLLELIFEIVYEGICELVGCCYLKGMQWIVPNKALSEKTEERIRGIITTITALLGIVLVVGLIFLVQNNPSLKIVGKYMTYIPLAIIGVQISLGIVVKIISSIRKRKAKQGRHL